MPETIKWNASELTGVTGMKAWLYGQLSGTLLNTGGDDLTETASSSGLFTFSLAESKTQAANDKRIVQAQIVQHEKALVGKMQDVLKIAEVGAAFAAVTQATFTELKAKLPQAAAWDIPTLMSFFPDAMAEVAGA